MFALIAFVLFAILELYVIVLVATAIGVLNTVGLLILFSLLGVWLAKHEGMWVLTRIREQLDAGTMPTNDLIEAGLVLVGGLFLIVPGFITDAIGLVFLFPPTRALARAIVRRRFRLRVYRYDGIEGPDDPDVIDV